MSFTAFYMLYVPAVPFVVQGPQTYLTSEFLGLRISLCICNSDQIIRVLLLQWIKKWAEVNQQVCIFFFAELTVLVLSFRTYCSTSCSFLSPTYSSHISPFPVMNHSNNSEKSAGHVGHTSWKNLIQPNKNFKPAMRKKSSLVLIMLPFGLQISKTNPPLFSHRGCYCGLHNEYRG